IAIANHGTNRRPCAAEGAFPDASRFGTQVWIPLTYRFVRLDLVRKWELIDCDLVLVGMSGPRSVESTIGLIFLIFFKNRQRTRIQFRICAIWIQGRHAANSEGATSMADRDQQVAEILEEGNVMRNGVAVRENPFGIVEVEMDERGHV